MEKRTSKLLNLTALMMLATPAVADWPVAIADNFTVHQDYSFTELDLLKNDIGSNLKVVDVNQWSEKGARISLRTTDRTSRLQYHAYGDVSYTPKDGFVGEDGFWYVVEDDQGRKNAIRVVVNVKPESLSLPTPLQDFIDVPKNTSVRIDPLENDLFSNKFTGAINTFRGNIADFNRTTAQGGKVERVEVYPSDSLSFGFVRFGGYRLENTLRYQLKYTPPNGFVGQDSFTYAVTDSTDQNGNKINDTVKWTKVALNVSGENAVSPWRIASPDKVTVNLSIGTSLASYDGDEIDVLQNDTGENLVVKLNSAYSQKGSRVSVIPNYPNRPVIKYNVDGSFQSNESIGTSFTDRVWYIVEDIYGRKNFSYVDVVVNIIRG